MRFYNFLPVLCVVSMLILAGILLVIVSTENTQKPQQEYGYFPICPQDTGDYVRKYSNGSCIVYVSQEEYLLGSDYIYKRDYREYQTFHTYDNGTIENVTVPAKHCYIYVTVLNELGAVHWDVDGVCYRGHLEEALRETKQHMEEINEP